VGRRLVVPGAPPPLIGTRLELVGLDGFAQTDLESVVHRNRGLRELSGMAFAIEHVMVQRFLYRRGWEAPGALQPSLRLPRPGPVGDVHLECTAGLDRERPPMMTVPEFAARTRRLGTGPAG
jgi:hypothetical protein